jgi:WD40 repeat protein
MFEIRHMPDGALLRSFNGLHNSAMLDVAWSPDGQTIASSHQNGLIKFTRADNGATLRIVEGRAGNGQALVWSPDGQILASYGVEVVELWRAADGTLIQTLPVNQHDIMVQSVVFSPDSQLLATGSHDGTIKLWRVGDGALIRTVGKQANEIQQMIFADQGRVLVLIDFNARLTTWRISDGSIVRTINIPSAAASSYVFSPDGQIIAIDSSGEGGPQVKLWRVNNGELLQTISLQQTYAMSLAFSADSKQLAIVDTNGKLTLWDTARRGTTNK